MGAPDTRDADLQKHAVSMTVERRLGERWSLQLGIGAALGGSVTIDAATHDILPGPFATGALSYRFVDGRGLAPFVLGSFSLGTSVVWTREPEASGNRSNAMVALDGRVGVTVGKTIAGILSPYAAGRAFGLPIFWTYAGRSAIGTDAYHYQVAFGLALKIGAADLLLEGVPLGERAITIASGFSF